MRIGELARLTGLAAMTIRYYEKIGLMPDLRRSSSNYRIYSQEDVERLRFIMHCRNQQIPLQDIRSLLELRDDRNTSDDAQIIGIIERHEQRIREQLAALETIADRLRALLADNEGGGSSRGQRLMEILAMPCPQCPDFGATASEHIPLGRLLPQPHSAVDESE